MIVPIHQNQPQPNAGTVPAGQLSHRPVGLGYRVRLAAGVFLLAAATASCGGSSIEAGSSASSEAAVTVATIAGDDPVLVDACAAFIQFARANPAVERQRDVAYAENVVWMQRWLNASIPMWDALANWSEATPDGRDALVALRDGLVTHAANLALIDADLGPQELDAELDVWKSNFLPVLDRFDEAVDGVSLVSARGDVLIEQNGCKEAVDVFWNS